VLGPAQETETMQENILDWIGLDKKNPGNQPLTKEELAPIIYFFNLHCLQY
jgi:hypothetical protein